MQAVDTWEMPSLNLRLNHAELRGQSRLNITFNTVLADMARCGCVLE